MENALVNTVIAFKLMQYSYTLKSFFKDELKKSNGVYIIPYSHILRFKKTVFQYIRDSCDYVCPHRKPCDGHQFLDFVEKLWNFERYAVEERKCFFKNFYFYNFRLKTDQFYSMDNQIDKIAGWNFYAIDAKDLSHLSYSQRLSYLN